MSKYTVKAIFPTIQGEGCAMGMPALFVRMAGCNMWSGIESKREDDAVRNRADCPRWCDTDFRGGTGHTAEELVAEITAQLVQPLIVITGGEPLLQVDQELVDALLKVTRPAGVRIAFETNGTVAAQFDQDNRGLWVTMSPKRSRAETVLTHCDELKLVYPPYDPEQWEDFPARHRWVQPVDSREIGIGEVNRRCVDFVLAHRDWRLGSQAHKAWGIA